ncbi:MAG: UDP-N-acetylglucosamine 1-carboxyvinyltransferase [Parcubacteria group bacterium Gr01-1014_48]|nr:MAG: UDP-N-acetylglucosamine 1-carboxyvinyltransferase [Parcubacteria group bacterium Greene0416_14]TSC73326.1 MAG: UDP-N-acetylglucosamine 1-carboxyvinyltransferase [Parcubacteria group bacterium Gr01-1014_48]TSC99953.1 MAG: UDP-N-acetylglucosamine 1-carboxyvinyltransferase [Parcubacteria group bacterium Greene1014_15]TSD07409.1 MAG: UDP-N-acetylglucosamine 1-carboxyvinyltransferase [Parcubacteria group bacterium Greene0714_4]
MTGKNNNIGTFIAHVREIRGITQQELANNVGTSQSAIARIEKGEQNMSMDMVGKISTALNKSLLTLGNDSMSFQISGGRKLSGSVMTNTSKNSAMALLCASLLNKGKTTLKNMPHIEEVSRIIEVLQSIGVFVKWVGNDIEIQPPKVFAIDKLDVKAANKTRSIIMFAGPLIHAVSSFTLPSVGGCKLGSRTVNPHVFILEKFGVKVRQEKDTYRFESKKLKPGYIVMYESGDTATNNALMAAARIPGKTTIKFASSNYMVQDLCFFLQSLDIHIEGIGTTTLIVHGKENIDCDAIAYPSEDPTESMFFLAAAIITHSELTIKRCPIEFLELELMKLEKMGFKYQQGKRYKAQNGATDLVDITTYPSQLYALEEKIYGRPYPGLNIDNLPFFAVIATQAKGTTLIHDWVYEKRAIYYTELDKLGAQTILADPHRIYITGPTVLKPAELICPPALRPATIILIAMLGAPGVSILRNVYSINRGYEDLVNRLNKLGADIRLLRDVQAV